MKTIEDVLCSLSDEDKGVVISAIEAEKTKGIESYRKAKSEVDRLIGKSKKYESIAGVLKDAEIDADSEDALDKLKERLVNAQAKPLANDAEIKRLQAQIKAFSDKLAEADERAAKIRSKTLLETVKGALKGKLFAHEEVAKSLVADGKVAYAEDGETIVWNDDTGSIDYSKGIESYIGSRKDIAITQQKPGSGSSPGSEKQGKKTLAKSDFDKMTQKEKAVFMADGGNVVE